MNERLFISKSLPLKARFYDYQHFTYPWHFHSQYEIIYVKQGNGTRFIGNNATRFTDGDIILLGSNLPHYLKSDDIYFLENNKLRVKGTIIQFEKEFMHYCILYYPHFTKISGLLDEAKNGIHFPKRDSTKLVTLLNNIPKKEGLDMFIDFLRLLQEMSEIKNRQAISSGDYTHKPFDDNSRIDDVISFLSTNYTHNIKLTEIASFAAMNPSAFCRFFKQKTGKSLKNYLIDMRIAFSCKLLLMNYKSISQISVECGFETISHFNKAFKKITSYTPTQYKEIMLK